MATVVAGSILFCYWWYCRMSWTVVGDGVQLFIDGHCRGRLEWPQIACIQYTLWVAVLLDSTGHVLARLGFVDRVTACKLQEIYNAWRVTK
jgi:hypothetical protein